MILVIAAAGIAIVALAIVSAIPNLRAYRPYEASEFTPQQIATEDLRATVFDEYLPRTAGMRFPAVRDAVVFRTWFFPVWSASVDSQPAPMAPAPGGLVAVRTPAGHHDVRLQLVDPVEREVGKAISAIALALLLLLALAPAVRRVA